MGIVANRLKISPAQLMNFAPIEIEHALDDWQDLNQQNWDLMRLHAMLCINPHRKKPISKPADLIGFAWDKKEEPAYIDDAYFDEVSKRNKRIFEKLKNGQNNYRINPKA